MSELQLPRVKLLRLFLLIVFLFLTINSPLHSEEFEKKVREHVIKYYVNDIFFDVQEQIKQKINLFEIVGKLPLQLSSML